METVYDILNHFKETKRRLTSGGNSDFITLDYMQLLGLIELSRREQQENKQLRDKLNKIKQLTLEPLIVEYDGKLIEHIRVERILEIIKEG